MLQNIIIFIGFILSILSFILSAYIGVTNSLEKRFNIDLFQDYDGDQSGVLVGYDGINAPINEKTAQPIINMIGLARITLTNKSSVPITIISFDLGSDIGSPFTSYTHTSPFYQITTKKSSIVNFGYVDKPLKYLLPLFTIPPYQSTDGYLSFWIHEKNILPGEKYPLKVKTSRGTKVFNIKFGSIYKPDEEYRNTKPVPIKYFSL